jgi:hypothetical protein
LRSQFGSPPPHGQLRPHTPSFPFAAVALPRLRRGSRTPLAPSSLKEQSSHQTQSSALLAAPRSRKTEVTGSNLQALIPPHCLHCLLFYQFVGYCRKSSRELGICSHQETLKFCFSVAAKFVNPGVMLLGFEWAW